MSASRPLAIRFDASGLEVEGGLLWLDARRSKPFGVITHAHGDHVARHQTILCTPETAALVRRRSGGGPSFIEARYGEKTTVGDLNVTLLPAGHILGSAMVLVEGPGGSLLYTGDVRDEGGLTCSPAAPVPAELLVTEATFGRPDCTFPPPNEVRAEMVIWARNAIEAGTTPVFAAYALGKGQEVMAALAAAEIPVAAHGSVWSLCSVYRDFGIRFPKSRRLKRGSGRRAAVVVPPRFLRTPEVQECGPLRVAAVTGWGDRTLGGGIERAFPLSDHSDFPGLLRVVEKVGASKVHVQHGYAEEFAAALRERGHDAEAVPGHSGPEEGERPGMFGMYPLGR
jgi:Cft2 family RNA processing exonuclease